MSSVTAEREIKGFKYSFAVEMDALSIEALHIQTGRLWKALLNSLSFCSGAATLTNLEANKLFELLTNEENNQCKITFPENPKGVVRILFTASFPFIGDVSSDILLKEEKQFSDCEKLERIISQMNARSDEMNKTLLEELKSVKQENSTLKSELSSLTTKLASLQQSYTDIKEQDCHLGVGNITPISCFCVSLEPGTEVLELVKIHVDKKYPNTGLLIEVSFSMAQYSDLDSKSIMDALYYWKDDSGNQTSTIPFISTFREDKVDYLSSMSISSLFPKDNTVGRKTFTLFLENASLPYRVKLNCQGRITEIA